jgi:predicted transcriptional regulator
MVSETKLAIRLPKPLKRRVSSEAKTRMLSEADVTREALVEYLDRREFSKSAKEKVAA